MTDVNTFGSKRRDREVFFERFERGFSRDHTGAAEHVPERHENLACGEKCGLQKSK
jgi:hypothetical protein